MSNEVKITYSEYGSNAVIDKASFELIEDMLMTLSCDNEKKTLTITMADTISDYTELEGTLSLEKLSILIRILSQIRNQIKG